MNKKVKLLVLNAFDMGGIERATISMANCLRSLGVDVEIVSLYKNESSFIIKDNIKVLPQNLNDYEKLSFYLNELNGNEITISMYDRISIYLDIIQIIKMKNNIVIAYQHADYEAHSFKVRFLRRIFYFKNNAVVALTEKDKNLYLNKLSNKLIKKIPNILDPEESIVNKKISERDLDIIAVGRLDPIKRFEDVIYISETIQCNTKIFGHGPDEGRLKSIAKDKRILCGSSSQIFKEMLNAKILLVTSFRESFSMVILEAMSMGCIVVSYDCPTGPAELIDDGINGFIIPNGDKDKMKDKCIEILQGNIDLNEISNNAINFSKKFYPEKIGMLWLDLFKEVENVN